jgi:hypothetical protein
MESTTVIRYDAGRDAWAVLRDEIPIAFAATIHAARAVAARVSAKFRHPVEEVDDAGLE